MVRKTTAIQTELAIGLSGGRSMPAWTPKIDILKIDHFSSHLNNTVKTSLSLPA